ncbi:DUF1307 domain-containing protein [Streptococcus sp.]|uniref:DUF1307 domain-containing protein n=1 Tax=Streptococcus sp. TaxID=1306 RepID=UPI00391BDA35
MKLRRMVLGLLALVGVGVLIACTTSTKTADYQRLVEGQMDIRNHFEYRGDKITLMETTTTIIYSAYGLTGPEDAEKQMLAQGSASWDGVEGITHEVDYQEDRLIETTSIDMSKVDLATLNELLPIETDDGKIPEYVSYKLTKDNFLNQGYTEVKDGKFKELE